MQRLPHLRVIIDTEPHGGDWNMAVDETLLETAISETVATLRWYRWREPTISLGYFQRLADVQSNDELARLPKVRRLTGGGAILHDDELTYSLAIPADQELFHLPQQLYDIVHLPLASTLRELGIPAAIRGTTTKEINEPFLCFQRKNEHDVTVNGQKILGSAQRRRRSAILQHGSLIERASAAAKSIPGIFDLCQVVLPVDFVEILAVQVVASIAETWNRGSLSDSELEMARQLCQRSNEVLLAR